MAIEVHRKQSADYLQTGKDAMLWAGILADREQYVAAREWLHGWARRLHAWWNEFDLLLTPTVTQPPVRIGALPMSCSRLALLMPMAPPSRVRQ